MAMATMKRMDANTISVGQTSSGWYGGKGVVRPDLGFGEAYGIGQSVWSQGDAFVVIHYCHDLRDQPQTEGFGPDENGDLISLGKLPPGWFVSTGNPGRIGG